MFGGVRLRHDVSAGATCLARDTYPNLASMVVYVLRGMHT